MNSKLYYNFTQNLYCKFFYLFTFVEGNWAIDCVQLLTLSLHLKQQQQIIDANLC